MRTTAPRPSPSAHIPTERVQPFLLWTFGPLIRRRDGGGLHGPASRLVHCARLIVHGWKRRHSHRESLWHNRLTAPSRHPPWGVPPDVVAPVITPAGSSQLEKRDAKCRTTPHGSASISEPGAPSNCSPARGGITSRSERQSVQLVRKRARRLRRDTDRNQSPRSLPALVSSASTLDRQAASPSEGRPRSITTSPATRPTGSTCLATGNVTLFKILEVGFPGERPQWRRRIHGRWRSRRLEGSRLDSVTTFCAVPVTSSSCLVRRMLGVSGTEVAVPSQAAVHGGGRSPDRISLDTRKLR